MFYDRKRKEIISSTSDASKRVEGNRHANGMSIVDSKVHAQVIYKLQHVSLTNCLITILLLI